MKISIIVPIYNVENYIIECLTSIVDQNYKNIECLLIDDCGKDNSIQKINNFLSGYHGEIKFELISHDSNKGASAARNHGLMKASGDYLYFLDADDILKPFAISELSEIALLNNADLIHGDIECENKLLEYEMTISKDYLPEYVNDKIWILNNFFLHVPISPCNKLIRRSILIDKKIYFKEGIVNEDVLWIYSLRKHVISIYFHKKVTYRYRYNSTSVMNSPANEFNRIKSYISVLKELVNGIDYRTSYIDSFGILKQFHHNKMIKYSIDNENYFKLSFNKLIDETVNHPLTPALFVPFFYILKGPKSLFVKASFIWKKVLGILYRISLTKTLD